MLIVLCIFSCDYLKTGKFENFKWLTRRILKWKKVAHSSYLDRWIPHFQGHVRTESFFQISIFSKFKMAAEWAKMADFSAKMSENQNGSARNVKNYFLKKSSLYGRQAWSILSYKIKFESESNIFEAKSCA